MGGEPTAKCEMHRKDYTMTTRELLTAIVNGAELNAEHITKAQEMLNSISRERKPSKAELEKQAANEALKVEIAELLKEKGAMIVADIVAELSSEERPLTTSKISAMCRQMVASEIATVEDVKVKGKGAVKQYAIA